MELILKESAKVYELGGLFYLQTDNIICQFDHNYYLELVPGNELYGYTIKRLKGLQPLPRSEGLNRINILLTTLHHLKESI